MKALDDVRAEVFAFLQIDMAGPLEAAVAGYKRVKAAIEAAHEAKPSVAEARALWDEIKPVASAKSMRYLSPLYPWGVVSWVEHLVEAARRAEVAHEDTGPCNCAFVRKHKFFDALRSNDFVQIGESNDFYDRYEEFRCPHCGALWRYVDHSTEQYSAWSWVPVTSTDSST